MSVNMSVNNSSTFKLYKHQRNHVKNIWDSIVKNKQFSYIDTSETGLGKTITSLYIGKKLQQRFGLKIMVVASSKLSLENNDGWLAWADKIGAKIDIAITYSKLTGKNNKIKHPYLHPNRIMKHWIATREFHIICKKDYFLFLMNFTKEKIKVLLILLVVHW